MSVNYERETSRALELFSRLREEGVEFLKNLYADQKSEELFLEFKRFTTAPASRGLSDSDKNNFKAILSGFANSDGGVVIWGIGTTSTPSGQEILLPPTGSPGARELVNKFENMVSGCTVPIVPGVETIFIQHGENEGDGFAATFVPKSDYAPHQTADDKRSYYMRAGSSFVHVPHAVLAGLFGRRPQPKVALRITASHAKYHAKPQLDIDAQHGLLSTLTIILENRSSAVGKDAYVSWRLSSLGHGVSLRTVRYGDWLYPSSGWSAGCVSKESNRLVPFAEQPAVGLQLAFNPPLTESLVIEIMAGCEGGVPAYARVEVDKNTLNEVHTYFKQRQGQDDFISSRDAYVLTQKLFDFPI